jgi:hypothetical protein
MRKPPRLDARPRLHRDPRKRAGRRPSPNRLGAASQRDGPVFVRLHDAIRPVAVHRRVYERVAVPRLAPAAATGEPDWHLMMERPAPAGTAMRRGGRPERHLACRGSRGAGVASTPPRSDGAPAAIARRSAADREVGRPVSGNRHVADHDGRGRLRRAVLVRHGAAKGSAGSARARRLEAWLQVGRGVGAETGTVLVGGSSAMCAAAGPSHVVTVLRTAAAEMGGGG